MATNWEILKRAAVVEFKSAYAKMSEDDWNEALSQAIRDYSHDRPLLKSVVLTLLSTSTDVDLPDDFIDFEELRGTDGVLDANSLVYDWVRGTAYEAGSFREVGRSFLRFGTASAGTATLWYWGLHALDGTTLKARDVDRVKLLFFSYGYGGLANEGTGGGGRIQAGPVSWDNGPFRAAYAAKETSFRAKYEKLVQQRAYGTRSSGASFNLREALYTGAGEWLG